MSEKHTFLSPSWFEAIAAILADHGGVQIPAHAEAKVNLVVTDTPFDSDVEFHMGSEGGQAMFGPGHLDIADVTLTTDYVTAAEVFVGGNPQAGMQAFMAGKVRVQGDMSKLMASQATGGGTGGNPAMQTAIQEVTAVPD